MKRKGIPSDEKVPDSIPAIQSVRQFSKTSGISTITLWRHRKAEWLEVTNIAGRCYVTAEAVRRYINRAEAGEFAKIHKVPSLSKESV